MATYPRESTARSVLRNVLIVVAVAITLYLLYLVRKPLGWIIIATFLAIAMSGPVNFLERHLGRRGIAIGLSYIGLLLIPIGLGAIIVPPVVTGANDLANDAPRYAADVQRFVQRNKTLRGLEKDYGVVTKVEQEARKLPTRLGGAAGTLRDLGLGLVNSIFAGVTIIVLSVFMVGGGRQWLRKGALLTRPDHAALIDRMVDRMAIAVGNYVAGALAQATIAGLTTFIVLSILGVPFAAPLSVVVFFFDLIPLVGATIGAIVCTAVAFFVSVPVGLITGGYFVAYQQVENYVLVPKVMKRTVDISPLATIVAALIGGSLLGVLGALLAIPVAAAIQLIGTEVLYPRQDAG